MGRSSRIDPTLSLLGTVFTKMNCYDSESLKQGLIDKSSDLVLFSPQCRANLIILQACSEINVETPKDRFIEAVE